MQFTSRKSNAEVVSSSERTVRVDLKFTQTGRYLIAAGSNQREGQEHFNPVLYISVVGDKGWAMHYPLAGKFNKEDDAAAAALHYGIQIITRQVKDVPRPDDPLPLTAV
ncbi:MAG TPA: hypothetical protein VGM16_11570 [Gammaproteobacteria bacterium]|jgi:hypothetical protein